MNSSEMLGGERKSEHRLYSREEQNPKEDIFHQGRDTGHSQVPLLKNGDYSMKKVNDRPCSTEVRGQETQN